MAKLFKITGMNRVLSNLTKASIGFPLLIGQRLMLAGLFVQRESQKIVPVDTANLKGGASTRNIGGLGPKTDIVVSYQAEYAVFVHEDMDARHKAGKRAKYLESVIREKRKEIFRIIAGK